MFPYSEEVKNVSVQKGIIQTYILLQTTKPTMQICTDANEYKIDVCIISGVGGLSQNEHSFCFLGQVYRQAL